MKKYQNFLSENFHFLVVKFSIYLNRRVFVMLIRIAGGTFSDVAVQLNISINVASAVVPSKCTETFRRRRGCCVLTICSRLFAISQVWRGVYGLEVSVPVKSIYPSPTGGSGVACYLCGLPVSILYKSISSNIDRPCNLNT